MKVSGLLQFACAYFVRLRWLVQIVDHNVSFCRGHCHQRRRDTDGIASFWEGQTLNWSWLANVPILRRISGSSDTQRPTLSALSHPPVTSTLVMGGTSQKATQLMGASCCAKFMVCPVAISVNRPPVLLAPAEKILPPSYCACVRMMLYRG